jgi:hypothetical protein
MAEDHAGLLRVLAGLAMLAPTPDFLATLTSTAGYDRTVLHDPATGFFAGSQDADESYFELPLEERRERTAPFVDRTSYTNWTCGLAGALCLAAQALDDDALLAEALKTLDNVDAALLDEDGLVYHVLQPGGTPEVRGLLTDQVAYARALLDAHEACGEARFLERAQTLCDAVIARFEGDGGGFYDRLPAEETLGRLAVTDRPIVDNGLFADVLLRLAALTTAPSYRVHAQAVLRLYARTSPGAGPFAATYARALRRYLSPEVTVRIVGEASLTAEFREAALRLPTPFLAIRTLHGQAAARLDLPPEPQPAAYMCTNGTCGAPVREAGALRAAYDALSLPHGVRT